MEYDVIHALQRPPEGSGSDEEPEVSGYIIIVGGAQPFHALATDPLLFSLRSPALYSAPRFGPINFGPAPDG